MARSNTANAANWFSRASASGLTAFPMSMSCWFYPFNLTSSSCLMAVSDAAASNYSALFFDGANAYARGDNVVLLDHGFPGQEAITTAVASANTWNHACSVDATNTSHTAYLNGVAGTTQTGSMPPVSQNHIDVGAIRNTTTTFSPLDGGIAEVAFWSAALTAAEVKMLSQGVSPLMIRPNNLNRYWPLIRGGANEIERILREVLVQNGTMGQAEHVRQFYPTGPVLIGFNAGGGTQNITGALVTDADTFYASTIAAGAVNISGALFTNTNTFYGSVLSSPYTITGVRFNNTNTFYGSTIATGAVNISGALFTDTDTFYGSTLSKTYGISGNLFTNSNIFSGSTISTGSVNISGNLFTDADTFYGSSLSLGAINISGNLFTNSQTFYGSTLSGTYNITGGLFTNSNIFSTATVNATYGITGNLFTNSNSFFGSTLSKTYSILGTLFTNTNTFFGSAISTGAVNISGNLFTNTNTFYGSFLGSAGDIGGNLFVDGDTFYGGTLGASYNISGNIYIDPDTFYAADIIAAGGGGGGGNIPTNNKISRRVRTQHN